MRKTIYLTLVVGALGLLTAMPTGAYAASSSGAQKINNSDCFYFGPYTECYSNKGEANNIQTPSGNYVFEENLAFTFSFSGPGVFDSNNGRFHEHFLVQDGSQQELQYKERATEQFLLPDGTLETCLFAVKYHEANGQIQYDHTEFTCTP